MVAPVVLGDAAMVVMMVAREGDRGRTARHQRGDRE
jgi:hypothetical protein